MTGDYLGDSDGQGAVVMPFYLLCDVSDPMRGELATLRRGIQDICDEVATRTYLDEVAQICIMSFADTAQVLVKLTPMSQAAIPGFGPARMTSYGAAFRTLATKIADDYENLSLDGYSVFRPCVYFLTAGVPVDIDWQSTFNQTLTKIPMKAAGVPNGYPILVPFGFRDAEEEILRQLAYPPGRSKWYHAQNSEFSEALRGILGIIMQSVLKSSSSGAAGKPVLDLPDPGPGNPWISHGTA